MTPEGRPILVPGVEPSLQGTKICPSTSGATNWMSPAYNPDTGLFYVVALEGCGINTKSFEKFRPGGFPFDATGYVESPEEPRQIVRAGARTDHRQAEMGVQADRLERLRRGPALNSGIG